MTVDSVPIDVVRTIVLCDYCKCYLNSMHAELTHLWDDMEGMCGAISELPGEDGIKEEVVETLGRIRAVIGADIGDIEKLRDWVEERLCGRLREVKE